MPRLSGDFLRLSEAWPQDTLMAKTRAQKEQDLTKLVEKVKTAKSVVFTDYRGLKMSQLADLRNKLAQQNAEFNVTKNTLMDLAIKNLKLEIKNSALEGPTATLFSFGDEVSPLKVLVKALKDAGIGKVKGGFLGETFMDEYSMTRLSNLPGKQELRGKVVGVLAAPLQGMVGVLNANLRNLVYILDQIKIQKGG